MKASTHFIVNTTATGTTASPTDVEVEVLPTKSALPVIDQIIIYGDPGATTRTLTATLFTGTDGEMLRIGQVYDANTPDTLNLPFHAGLPTWPSAKSGVYQSYGNPLIGSAYLRIEWDTAPTACTVCILYHYESPAERTSFLTTA